MVFLTDETLNLLLQKLPELVTMEISYCKYSPENIDNVVKVSCFQNRLTVCYKQLKYIHAYLNLQNISNHASLQELALYKCDVSIAEVFLRGIQDRTDMRKLLIFPFFPGIGKYVSSFVCISSSAPTVYNITQFQKYTVNVLISLRECQGFFMYNYMNVCMFYLQ